MADRQGLVPKKVQVTRNGKTHTQIKWVKPSNVSTEPPAENTAGKDFLLVGSQVKLLNSGEQGKIIGVDNARGYWIVSTPGIARLHVPKDQVLVLPVKNDTQVKQVIQQATPETRGQSGLQLSGGVVGQGEEPTVPFVPQVAEIQFNNDKKSMSSGLDYSTVLPKDVHLPTDKSVAEQPKPSYIPDLDITYFGHKRLPSVVPLSDGNYALWTKPNTTGLVKVSPEVLVATFQYHSKLNKLQHAQRSAKRLEELKLRHPNFPEEDLIAHIKKGAPKNWKLQENKTSTSQMNVITAFTDATPGTKWTAYSKMVQAINITTNDMDVLSELEDNSYYKGRETAYGNQGTKADLYESHGVLVKRQNGSEITKEQIEQISKSLTAVSQVIGPTKELAKSTGLKISHSGDKLMHARNAAGLYVPSMNAIGVTAKEGDVGFGFTLAHEVSHFIDHKLGSAKQARTYASHDPRSTAGQIATAFRSNLATASSSKYVNASHECFARALEQHFGTQTQGGKMFELHSNQSGIYASEEKFKTTIQPLIEKFLSENKSFIKSFPVRLIALS